MRPVHPPNVTDAQGVMMIFKSPFADVPIPDTALTPIVLRHAGSAVQQHRVGSAGSRADVVARR